LFLNLVELNFQNCEEDPAWILKLKKGEATYDPEQNTLFVNERLLFIRRYLCDIILSIAL
jgi:hypothetical protein